MKRISFTLLILSLTVLSFSQNVSHVDAIKFDQLIKSGEGVILDVRTPREYTRGHIASSTLISIADREFVNKIQLLQKDKPIYIYCLTGSRSRTAANYMAKIGFTKVYNLQRGILDWQRNSLPVVQSTAPIASTSKIYTPQSFSQFINSNKLVLVDFHAQWCAPCKQMAPIIDQLSKDYSDKVKIEKIDVEANRAIAEANQIQSIPGFILYKNGQQVWLHKGMISHADLSQVLNQHL